MTARTFTPVVPSRLRRNGNRWAVLLPCVVPLVLVPSVDLSAQSVRVTITDAETGSPLRGVFVTVTDEQGELRVAGLTNSYGRLLLAPRSEGPFRIRAELVGRAPVDHGPLSIISGQATSIELQMAFRPIDMAGITAVAEQRCTLRPQEGEELATIWGRIRTALAVATWSRGEGLLRFDLERFTRELDQAGRRVTSDERRGISLRAREPYRTLPPESLARDGYIQAQATGIFAYAPDPQVLISDHFLDSHCFRLVSERGPEGQIGLGFEPYRDRTVTGIRGVLWVSGEAGELQRMDFEYTNLQGPLGSRLAGGAMEFSRLPDGHWIVSDWRIRFPIVEEIEEYRSGAWRPIQRHGGFVEEGGHVRKIFDSLGRELEAAPRALLTGSVRDGPRGSPLAGAVVSLVGTEFTAISEPDGTFLMADLPEGTYHLTFEHERVGEYVLPDVTEEVHLTSGRTTEVSMGIPDDAIPVTEALEERADGFRRLELFPGTGTFEVDWVSGLGSDSVRSRLVGDPFTVIRPDSADDRSVGRPLAQDMRAGRQLGGASASERLEVVGFYRRQEEGIPGHREVIFPSLAARSIPIRHYLQGIPELAGRALPCTPALYVNGVARDPEEMDRIPLGAIEAWEFYPGDFLLSEYPVACGVILLWEHQ